MGTEGKAFREKYRTICRDAHGDFPFFFHVHHIDKNRENNEPENLIAVPAKVHLQIHKLSALPDRKTIEAMLLSYNDLKEEYQALKSRKKAIAKEKGQISRRMTQIERLLY